MRDEHQWLAEKAIELADYLGQHHAVRHAGCDVGFAVPRDQIMDALGLDQRAFQPVKIKAAELGIDVAISHRGHYVGQPGEAVTYVVWAMRMIQALAQGINRYLAAMDAAGTLADGRDLARYRLGYPTHHIPARLKALGVVIDDRVRQKWLEPGQAGRQLALPTMGRTGTNAIDGAAFLRQYQNLIGPIIEEERKERDQ